jgi:hypothetical protein
MAMMMIVVVVMVRVNTEQITGSIGKVHLSNSGAAEGCLVDVAQEKQFLE